MKRKTTVHYVNNRQMYETMKIYIKAVRRAVREKLEQTDGTHLVLVRYGPRHSFHEWVANQADIDASGIVWARDRGPIDDELLRRYYPARKVWLQYPAMTSDLSPHLVGRLVEGGSGPTPATIRVVQIEPGPTPTFTMSAPALMRSRVPSTVTTLPATMGMFGATARTSSMACSVRC